MVDLELILAGLCTRTLRSNLSEIVNDDIPTVAPNLCGVELVSISRDLLAQAANCFRPM